jgi:hypothetical protein
MLALARHKELRLFSRGVTPEALVVGSGGSRGERIARVTGVAKDKEKKRQQA